MIPWNGSFLKKSLVMAVLALLLGCIPTSRSKAIAADTLSLRLGLWQIPVSVNDVEDWLETGELPPSLGVYRWLLTPSVRQRLQQRFHVDSMVATAFLQQLWQSQEGEQLLNQLATAFPQSDQETLKEAIALSWEETEDFSFLSFIRAYPHHTLKVDLAAVTKMGLQLQSASLQKQLLSPQLAKALRKSPPQTIPSDLDPTQSGQKVVYLQSLILKDQKRERTIPIDIYYSRYTTGSLVVMSHGFAADRQFSTYLARHLASHGLTVV